MKRIFAFQVICILFYGCVGVQSQNLNKNKELQEFVIDLSSINNKLRGKLLLFGEYKDDLSKLNYKRYVELLKVSETESNKGVTEIIKTADEHIFGVKTNSFLIAIYSKQLNAVLYDDANTAFTDSIIILNNNYKIPDLRELVKNTGFKIINE